MICPSCGKTETRKAGFSNFKKSRNQRYRCKACGRVWSRYDKNPKLLYFDIEVTHAEYSLWRGGKQYVSSKRITKDWIVLSWAAKWVCTTSMYSMVLRPKEIKEWNDKRLAKGLWNLFNQADIIIGHNSNRFDIKKMNWRWEMHELGVPKPYRVVDTLVVARRVFGPPADLDYLAKRFKLNGGKPPMHQEDWDACEAGDPKALRKMREYNENDVLIGEGVYLKTRKWDKNHPNLGLYYETTIPRCKNCASTELDIDEKTTITTGVNTWFCWTCINCGANGRTPESARYETALSDEITDERKMRVEENKEKRLALMR